MLPAPVSGALDVVLLAVVAWCLYSLLRRPAASTRDVVPADVEAWHGVMGAAMLALLSWTPSTRWAWLGCGVFAWMALWSVVRASDRTILTHVWRAGLMAAVMVAMLVPAGAASAATPMPAMGSASGRLLSGPAAAVVGLAMVLVAGVAVRVAHRTPDPRSRLSTWCEAVMASVMALMALAMV